MSGLSSNYPRGVNSTSRSWKVLTQIIIVLTILFPSPGFVYAQPPPPPSDPSLGLAQFTEVPGLLPEYTGCGGQYPDPINAAFEQQVVELVNAERSSRGLPPLKRDELLDQAARYHAADMDQDDYFAHDSYDRQGGSLVRVCVWSIRIGTFYSSWYTLGENIAVGYPSPQSVMNGWMSSPGHRDNILNTSFREIGVGFYSGNHWVQDFGKRTNVYPLIIDYEAAETESRDVSLYIYGNSSIWTEMRLRNNDLSWSEWMPFQNTPTWQLPNASGVHTVTVELRKGSTTTTSQDSIHLTLASTPELGNLPESISFTYSIADQLFTPSSVVVTPLNMGDEVTLTWETSQSDGWYQVNPPGGDTPQALTITPVGSITTTGVYNGSLTVTVTSPDGTLASPWEIAVNLTVVDGPQRMYLPAVVNGYP